MPAVLPKWPPDDVAEYIGLRRSSSEDIALGVKSNTEFTLDVNSLSVNSDVLNDSTLTLTGVAIPITYDN